MKSIGAPYKTTAEAIICPIYWGVIAAGVGFSSYLEHTTSEKQDGLCDTATIAAIGLTVWAINNTCIYFFNDDE